MLSPATGRVTRPLPARHRAVLAAVLPTARVAHVGAAGATVALGTVPLMVEVARGGAAAAPVLVPILVIAGAAVAWAAEDPAADLLAATPLSSPARTAMRAVAAGLVAVVGAVLAVAVVTLGPGFPPDLADRVPEAAAGASIALGAGLVAARRGERGAGPIGVTAGVLGIGLIAALAYRWPATLPSFAGGPAHARWWIVTAVGAVVVIHAGRDPGRRWRGRSAETRTE